MHSTCVLGTFLVLLRVSDLMAQSFYRSEEGPYNTVINNVSRCGSPPAWLQWNMTTYSSKGRSLISGFFATTRNVKDVKFRILMYLLEEKKQKVFDVRNQNCHNAIVAVLLKAAAVPFTVQNCLVKAGSYGFKDLNVDAIIHTVVQSLWYGPAQLRVQLGFRETSPLICFDVYLQIMKLN